MTTKKKKSVLLLTCMENSSSPETYHVIKDRLQSPPTKMLESFFGFLSSPDELILENEGFISTMDFIPVAHKVVYNESKEFTELAIQLMPLRSKRQDAFDFDPQTFDSKYIPYFVAMYEPWSSRPMRAFSTSFAASLIQDAPVLTFDVWHSSEPETLALFNSKYSTSDVDYD